MIFLPCAVGLFHQAFLLESIEHAKRCGACHRIARIGAANAAGLRRIHDLGAADHARQRKAARQRFGACHQVRLHAEMLHGKPFARAPEARLDFIGNQHNAMLVAELAQPHQKFFRRNVKSAFALHRLDDDGGNARSLHIAFEQHLDGVNGIINADALVLDRKRHMPDAAGHRAKTRLVGQDFSGERHAEQCAAMKGPVEGDDIGTPRVAARKLDGVFNRLCAGGDQR